MSLRFDPQGVELLRDGSQGDWIANRLWDTTSGDGLRVGAFIPPGFEAYARIFHPVEYQSKDLEWHKLSWSEVAAWHGKTPHPQMDLYDMAGLDQLSNDIPSCLDLPDFGRLPIEECEHLLGILKEFTTTPRQCYFGLWHGYGFIDARYHRAARTLKIDTLAREYFVFQGVADRIAAFYEGLFSQSPNLWWPDDRAWCVSTEIDHMDSYVGGSATCIERVLAHPGLEALPIATDARLL